MKRSTTRNITISKAFKHIDLDTRKDLKDRRLLALEADNFGDTEAKTEAIDDDDDFDGDEESTVKTKRRKNNAAKNMVVSKWSKRPIKSFERVLFEQGFVANEVNYNSITAGPPTARCVQLCSVCGYLGDYSCTRCGMKYCSVRCQQNHVETRCMKLSL